MECKINDWNQWLLKMAVFLKITLTRCHFHCCCVFLSRCSPPQNQLNQRNRTSSSNLAVNGILIQWSNMKLLNLNLNCCQAFKCRWSIFDSWVDERQKNIPKLLSWFAQGYFFLPQDPHVLWDISHIIRSPEEILVLHLMGVRCKNLTFCNSDLVDRAYIYGFPFFLCYITVHIMTG